jgi:Ca-activated chloride channel family protein
MSFLWPDLLWLLLCVPALIAAYAYALARRKKLAIRYTSLMLVRGSIGTGQRIRRHLPPFIFLVAVTAGILAVARPSAVFTLPSQQQTIVLAVDVSRSMRATDVEPNRITAAQGAARAFIEEMPRNVRVGIVTFAGTAAIVQTPTDNREDLLATIDRFQLQRATATGSGLLLSLSVLFPEAGIDLESIIFDRRMGSAPLNRNRRPALAAKKDFTPVAPGSYTAGLIILLSDGRRTTGPDPIEAAKLAAERGVRVYTVGFGSRAGGAVDFGGWSAYVVLDEETLKAVAQATGGEYFYAGTAADLRKVYQHLNAKFALEKKEVEMSALLGAAAALLAICAALLSLLWFHRTA